MAKKLGKKSGTIPPNIEGGKTKRRRRSMLAEGMPSFYKPKMPSKAEIKKRNAEQTKVFKTIITTALMAREGLEINKSPGQMKKNVSIATKTASEICKQNKITDETIEKMFKF